MSPETAAQLHGILSAALGFLFAWTVWRFAIRARATNRWVAGLQFTLWSIIPGVFFMGAPISRVLLGLGEPLYGTSLRESVQGTIGLWLIGLLVLFPIGVARASKSLQRPAQVDAVPRRSATDMKSWRWFHPLRLWLFTIGMTALIAMLADELEHEYDWVGPAAIALIVVAQGRALLWTYKWLAVVQPHVHWHWAKLAILWAGAVGATWLFYVQMEYEWLPIVIFGGSLVFCVCLMLTWTWLSAREGHTPHSSSSGTGPTRG